MTRLLVSYQRQIKRAYFVFVLYVLFYFKQNNKQTWLFKGCYLENVNDRKKMGNQIKEIISYLYLATLLGHL